MFISHENCLDGLKCLWPVRMFSVDQAEIFWYYSRGKYATMLIKPCTVFLLTAVYSCHRKLFLCFYTKYLHYYLVKTNSF